MKIDAIPMSEQLRMLRTGGSTAPLDGIPSPEDGSNGGQVSFVDFLSQQFQTANQSGIEAERALEQAVLGEEVNPHNTVIAVQKASISLTLMMTIKERLERAYQELIRTPLG
ncbi:MAG: flagellar hook-basal body complex protein FliE [Bdellovibrionales bacterium]|nr:flagellar hook-basal body complex protein FliE [Bdellovibrionales bacterium]